MTTLAVRAQEEAIERRAGLLAQPAGRDVGEHGEGEREQGGRGAHRRTPLARAGAGPAHRDRARSAWRSSSAPRAPGRAS